MYRICTNYELNKHLLVLSVIGQAPEGAILRQADNFVQTDPARILLWDFSRGALQFCPNEHGELSINLANSKKYQFFGRKTAIFCPNEIDYGLFRILRVFTKIYNFPTKIRIFRDMRAARHWLGACRICLDIDEANEIKGLPCRRSCKRHIKKPSQDL